MVPMVRIKKISNIIVKDESFPGNIRKRRMRVHRNDAEIIDLYEEKCCTGRCLWNLSPNMIMEREKWLKSKKEVGVRQWLLDEVHQHAYMKEEQIICQFMIAGR